MKKLIVFVILTAALFGVTTNAAIYTLTTSPAGTNRLNLMIGTSSNYLFLSNRVNGVSNYVVNENLLVLLTNGSRGMSGNLLMNSNSIIAPLSIVSPTSLHIATNGLPLYFGKFAEEGGMFFDGTGNISIGAGNNIYIGTNNNCNDVRIGMSNLGNTIIDTSSFAFDGSSFALNYLPTASNEGARLWEVWQATNALSDTGVLIYTLQGNLIAASNQIKVHIPYNLTFTDTVGGAVFTAPTGTNISIGVDLNGASLFGVGTNLLIPISGKTNWLAASTTNANRFDELTIHILQVGSTISGGYLTLMLPMVRR
jgi:hypothetical protein